MKRLISLVLILLVVLSCLPAWAQEGENLVYNGDFSILDSSGMPDGWKKEMWYTDAGISQLYTSEDGCEGNCAVIVNADPNDARFAQTISVEPSSTYRFSCMVKAEGCGTDGYGATISFADCFSYSAEGLDTQGEWQEISLYGRTGRKQKELTLFIRVGGYGNLGSGKASFDNVQAVKVDSVPEEFEILPLSTVDSSSNNSSASTADNGEPARNTETWLLMACLYCVLMLALARRSYRFHSLEDARSSARRTLAAGLAIALALRLIISVLVRGYHTDISCFSAWSERIFAMGPGSFYAPDYFCDYPPGYMLLLWPIAALRSLLGLSLQGGAHLLLLKLIPVLCDILGAALVFRFAEKKRVQPRLAAALALIYAFNPAAIIDCAAWGQIDSVFTLLVALCAIKAADEKYIPSLIAFTAAMLVKPQAMLFAPLGLFAIVVNLIRSRSKKKLLDAAIGLASSLALLYAAGLLFCGNVQSVFDPISRLVSLYGETLGSYSYITINALNLYQALNLNWVATESQPIITIFAWCMFGLSYLFCAFLYAKSGKKKQLLLTGGLLITLIYCFGPKIHERYIFPAMLLLLLAYVSNRDRRLLSSLTILTAVTMMNEILVLQGGMTEANFGHLQDSERWLNLLLSIINCANALWLSWISMDICVLAHVRRLRRPEPEELAAESAPSPAGGHHLNLRRMECLLVAAVTLLYSGVAFFNLGSTAAPQTSWISSQAGESVTFDLGSVQTFRPIYYGGICNSTFTVELSDDGASWTEPVRAKYSQGEIFRWIYFVPQNDSGSNLAAGAAGEGVNCATTDEKFPMQTARYFRITAESAGLTLSEFGFWSEDGSLLSASISERSGEYAEFASDPALLLDEQDSVAEVPSWYNSTYFDEIYHARTAYELQNGMSIYEWTHPPLGKLTMMLGIEIFGMTPFGWRFMGALVGVLMVPLMYLLAKQLTKNAKVSFIAMCLMALDSMHFTQTRIATIDSYAVFWIMLMYLFMIRYFQMDWQQVKLGRTLVPLGLCGITMGVAVATKWIGAYAAIGLAVLYFWKMASELIRTENFRSAMKRAVISCLFCVLFFIIIPLLIYYLSYTRQLACEGVNSILDMFSMERVRRVIEMQEDMLGYHAGLGGDTHYFRSPWYQWPVIWWPMWYYSGADYVASDMVSSISCMGNPAVWWGGLICLIVVLIGAAWKRRAPKTWLVVLIGFASQFLPWVLVPRSTFIYHYFASVPFIILCVALVLKELESRDRAAFRWASGGLVSLALLLFVAFYPLESGMPVAKDYAKYLRWFKWYNY